MITRITTALTITFAMIVVLAAGTSIVSIALADSNSNGNAPLLAPGQNDPHRNPSSGNGDLPPGQTFHGNPGQCQQEFDNNHDFHDFCHRTP
jgi:hypothetical protein